MALPSNEDKTAVISQPEQIYLEESYKAPIKTSKGEMYSGQGNVYYLPPPQQQQYYGPPQPQYYGGPPPQHPQNQQQNQSSKSGCNRCIEALCCCTLCGACALESCLCCEMIMGCCSDDALF